MGHAQLALDTLTLTKRLQKAGLKSEPAQEIAKIQYEVFTNHVATKQDLDNLEQKLNAKIDNVETELKADIGRVETELKSDIKELRSELMVHSVKMVFVTVGLLGGLMTLFHYIS